MKRHLASYRCLDAKTISITVRKKKDANAKKPVGLIMHYTTSKRGKRVPMAQVLKDIERASKPEQPGLSSSIRLEIVCT